MMTMLMPWGASSGRRRVDSTGLGEAETVEGQRAERKSGHRNGNEHQEPDDLVRAACRDRASSQALNFEEIRVGSRHVVMNAHDTTGAPDDTRPRATSCRPISEVVASTAVASSAHTGDHAPVERQAPRTVGAVGGRENRRAGPQRRQAPRGFAAARDRDDRLRVAALGQGDGRLAERLRVIVVARRKARRAAVGLDSASRMIASSVCTARAGNAPAAVSPASMIASTPSSTALAASLTSARVGRGSVVIDSSTCVATMTGMRCRHARARDFLLDARNALERHLEAEIASAPPSRASHASRISSSCVERLRPLELRDEHRVRLVRVHHQLSRLPHVGRGLHETERDHVDAEREAETEVVHVLRRDGRRRQRDARRVDALVLAELAAFDDGRVISAPSVDSTRSSIGPVREQQLIAGAHALRQTVERRRDAMVRAPTKSPVTM